jgi:N-acetylneuraminic acid mutarotase
MPLAREHAPGVALGGDFYVIGGRLTLATGGSTAEVDRFIPAQNRWQRVSDMLVAANGFPAVTAGGQIVVFGGEEPGTPQLRLQQAVTEAYDPFTNRWARLPDMRTPRGAETGAAIGDRVYAIEGIKGPLTAVNVLGFTNLVEALDIQPLPTAPASPTRHKCRKHHHSHCRRHHHPRTAAR